ncbi:MAG: hypothetical protein OCC49_15070 [Fibrobacterales bacterium]
MFKALEPYYEEFQEKLLSAIAQGFREIEKNDPNSLYCSNHFNWPSLTFHRNGLPWLSKSLNGDKKDYSTFFSKWDSLKTIDYEIPKFKDFIDFVKK